MPRGTLRQAGVSMQSLPNTKSTWTRLDQLEMEREKRKRGLKSRVAREATSQARKEGKDKLTTLEI